MNLREVRQSRFISQKKLSELSGVSRVTIARLECGLQKNTKVETFQKLCNALNCSYDDLLRKDDSNDKT